MTTLPSSFSVTPSTTPESTRYMVDMLWFLGGAVVAVIGLVIFVPAVQREIVYMHHFNWPFGDLSNPITYGLPPGKARNIRLGTNDGQDLGAWHVLPRSVYRSLGNVPLVGSTADEVFEKAMDERPTVLFFHGNAANRAVPYRVRIYTAISNQLDCNVLTLDYRGFGDSTGTPTEKGLILDARAAFDYIATSGSKGRQIILAGHSLGTGVISQLLPMLQREDLLDRIRAVVLISPFSSLEDLLAGYWGIRWFRGTIVERLLRRALKHKFDSISSLQTIDTSLPILIMHAENDWTINISHAQRLFDALSLREAVNSSTDASPVDWQAQEQQTYSLEGWGTVRQCGRPGKGQVVFWQGKRGGHNDLGWTEAGLDLVASIARL